MAQPDHAEYAEYAEYPAPTDRADLDDPGDRAPDQRVDVLVVGAGFAGLGMAIALTKAGRLSFVVLEKAADVGGTWRDNTYPGCACDIPSAMYSYSFEQNPDWSNSYSGQPEIWAYLRRVADQYDLRRRIHFNQEMADARWASDRQVWRVTTRTGGTYEARVVVSGTGALHLPLIPDLDGIEDFEGPSFHSSQWNHDVPLAGKRVAVVGTGASAIQFVPRLAPVVESLTVFQRTPPWILPRPDHPVSARSRALFRRWPTAQRAHRNAVYWMLESRAVGFNGHPAMLRIGERMATRYLEAKVHDPVTRAQMTPSYRMGCKRVLTSRDYLPAFNRDNVHLVASGVTSVRRRGVVDGDGVEHEADVVVYGTGFHVVDAFQYLNVTGVGGQDLALGFADHGVETYLGINVHGFPNWFFLLGPNTGLGHNSVVFMIEPQVAYAMRLLEEMDRRGAGAVDVRPEAQRVFNASIQSRLARGIWSTGGCRSWYLDVKGVNRAIWPGFTWRYWLETRRVDTAAYDWVPAARVAEPAPAV